MVLLPGITWVLPRVDTYSTEVSSADSWINTIDKGLLSPDLRWSPHYPGTVWEDRFAIMTDGGISVEIYGNQYHEQTQGSELIFHGSHLFDPVYFSPNSSSIVYLQDSKGQSTSARRDVLIDSMGTAWLTMYTYLVDSEPIASSRHAQLMTALRSTYSRTTAGVIAVATPCMEDCKSRSAAVAETFTYVLENYRSDFSE